MAVLIVAGIAQTVLAPQLSWQSIHPNFLLVIVMAWAMLKKPMEAILLGFFGGIVLDVFSSTPFGVFSISMSVVAFLATFWEEKFEAQIIVLPIALILPYSILFSLLSLVLLKTFGGAFAWNFTLLKLVFSVALVNLLVMVVIYPLLNWIELRKLKQETFRL